MNFTEMPDGRWLLELDGNSPVVLAAFEAAQVADQLGASAPAPELHKEAEYLRMDVAARRKTIDRLTVELESTREQAKKFWGLARDLQEANARLDAELAEYKATRATGGPWRPADQTWVSADIEPPASASDDTAPPLFRGLTVDKKETA